MPENNSFEILEFDKIRTILSGKTLTPLGKERCLEIKPLADNPEVNRILDETTELVEILKFEEPFPLQRIDDSDRILDRVAVEGTFLDPESLLKVAVFLEVCAKLKRYIKNKRDKYPLLSAMIDELKLFAEITSAIDNAVDKTGEIKDSASPELRRIRIELGSTQSKVLSKLEQIIRSRPRVGTRQDDVVTMRDGRYVIPVAESDMYARSGVVHDRSKSGATLFVEPMETVELNNRLRELDKLEEQEIERILLEISDTIRENLDELRSNYRVIGEVDFIHARGLFSIELDCDRPAVVDQTRVKLMKARHPLLLRQAEKATDVIPLSVSLGGKYDALVVTGPNTGGKTVALKTLGLLILMARSGLHIPASKDSEIGTIDRVFADIGDEQSIELSLSTFSSHLKRIINALESLDSHTLVLLDEIGAGTDPKEGAALGEAIIAYIVEHGALALVTTHYSALKTLPEKYPRVENASLQFDHETLQPTYRFTVGIPGSSYAVDIAKRLGMPDKVIQTATGLVGTHERSLSNLIEKLENELRNSRRQQRSLEQKKKAVDERKKELREREAKLKQQEREFELKGLDQAEDIVEKTRRELENLVKRIREHRADEQSVKSAHRELRDIEEKIEHTRRKRTEQPKHRPPHEDLRQGDRVWIETLQTEGYLIEEEPKINSWKVQIGNMLSSVKSNMLRKLEEPSQKPSLPSGVNYAPFEEEVSTQISVRGMTVDEASDAVDRFLDRTALANLQTVYILHGKGTGALRAGLHRYLSTHPLVEDFRLGYVSEGSTGVTVVTLKRD